MELSYSDLIEELAHGEKKGCYIRQQIFNFAPTNGYHFVYTYSRSNTLIRTIICQRSAFS